MLNKDFKEFVALLNQNKFLTQWGEDKRHELIKQHKSER